MMVRILSGSQKGQVQELPQVNAEQAIQFGYAEKYEEPAAARETTEAPPAEQTETEMKPPSGEPEDPRGETTPSADDLDRVAADAAAAAATEKPAE